MAYTSRNEIEHSIKEITTSVLNDNLNISDISMSHFEKYLYTDNIPDILIRTSGETRLSDFLLWQTSFSTISFLSVLWPEISSWHLFFVVLQYQSQFKTVLVSDFIYYQFFNLLFVET